MGSHNKTAMMSVGVAAAALVLGAGGAHADTGDTTAPAATSVPADTTVPAEPTVLSETAVPTEAVECVLLAASVDRETATFTVGPDGCVGEVGPISFSAFFLPGGMRDPHEDQVLITHHESNGTVYGAGTYVLTVSMGTPCNWQTDLYYGVNLMPTFRGLIAYDFEEREVCTEETTTTTTPGETTTTTIVGAAGGSATSTSTTSTSTTTTTTTVVGAAGGSATSTSVASAGPIPVPNVGSRALPATGSSDVNALLAVLAGILLAAGLFARRLAR